MLDETQKLLNERQRTHGDFKEVASVAQTFRELMRGTDGWQRMNDAQREALDSMATKFGRLGSGDPHYRDHWDDVAGYATLASLHCDSGTATIACDIAALVEKRQIGPLEERFPPIRLPKVGKEF